MKIDWFTFAAQIVNFAILVWLLNRFLYGPITRAMQKREASIDERIQLAELQQNQAQEEKENYQVLSKEMETQRRTLFDKARQDADQAERKLLEQARARVNSRRQDWLKSLKREQDSLVKLVRQRAGDQVVSTTRKALTQLADVELESRTIEIFLKQLQGLNAAELEYIQREVIEGNPAKVVTAFALDADRRQRVSRALEPLGLKNVAFETVPDLVCGIELHVGGHKIGWSIQEYLMSLSEDLSGLLTQEI